MLDSLETVSEVRICVQMIEKEEIPREARQGVGEAAQGGDEAQAKTQAEPDPGSSFGTTLEPTASSNC